MKVLIKDIQPAFNNAHRPMWEKHSGGRVLSHFEADALPIEWWQKEYNVKIHATPWPVRWESAEFESQEAFTWFMLIWS
jgi:hypothetical protein